LWLFWRRVSPLTGEALFLVLPRKSTQKEGASAVSLGYAEFSALLDDTEGMIKTESSSEHIIDPALPSGSRSCPTLWLPKKLKSLFNIFSITTKQTPI
jgi:hypothetical protein